MARSRVFLSYSFYDPPYVPQDNPCGAYVYDFEYHKCKNAPKAFLNFEGVEFVLTALFVTMLVEQWLNKQNRRSVLIGAVATVLCLLIFGRELFLIPAMALIAILLTISRKTARRAADA